MDNKQDPILNRFNTDEIGIKVKRYDGDEAKPLIENVEKQYAEFINAKQNRLDHVYEVFYYREMGHKPWNWLIDFLKDQSDIIAVGQSSPGSKWKPTFAYWFANGEDAYWKLVQLDYGRMFRLYYLSNLENSFFIYYDDVKQTLVLMGEELIKWAKSVRNRFYDAVGVPNNSQVFLTDVRTGNWGNRLILDCEYRIPDAPIMNGDRGTFMIMFDGCNYKYWHPMSTHDLRQSLYSDRRELWKVWIWMGYTSEKDYRMTIPATIQNLAINMEFTYESFTVVKGHE
jgi:hypothetical protein